MTTAPIQLTLSLHPHTEPADYASLPLYAGGLSHPVYLWYRGARWQYVAGSALAGVVEYRRC
jgi:hypothetical protein